MTAFLAYDAYVFLENNIFIFGKAVDFWGSVGLLSSSPIPSHHPELD